jgi:hypothetical protein
LLGVARSIIVAPVPSAALDFVIDRGAARFIGDSASRAIQIARDSSSAGLADRSSN